MNNAMLKIINITWFSFMMLSLLLGGNFRKSEILFQSSKGDGLITRISGDTNLVGWSSVSSQNKDKY